MATKSKKLIEQERKKGARYPDSIRINLGGQRTATELRDMLMQAMIELEHDHPPEQTFHHSVMFVTPVAPRGKDLNTITIKHPYPCAADEHDAG